MTNSTEKLQTSWRSPSSELLPNPTMQEQGTAWNGVRLANLLTAFGTPCIFITETHAAAVSTYHFDLNSVLSLNKIPNAVKLLSAQIKTEVIQTNSNTGHFAIQIPRQNRQTVYFKQALLQGNVYNSMLEPGRLTALFGTDTENKPLIVNLDSLPHLLISGSTGSGKSVLLNTIICSLLMRQSPSTLQITAVDLKKVELTPYNGLPHLAQPVITEIPQAVKAIDDIIAVMENRYTLMEQNGWRIIPSEYPRILMIIDEYADIVLQDKGIENKLSRLAAKARAAGIHLIIATQSPNADVVTKLIRVNFPARISLKCGTAIDSRISSGMFGADAPQCQRLLGFGDSYFIKDGGYKRFQAAYCSDSEIERICEWWRSEESRVYG